VGSKLAVAVAGAGAESTNTILGKTDAYILSSDIDDAGKLTIAATQQSNIDALVLALSGGAAAIGCRGRVELHRRRSRWRSGVR